MGMKLNTTAIALVLLLASAAEVSEGASFDVTKHGAKADGSDISQALLAAWKEACASPTPSSVLVPAGTYGLGQICFEGPCKAPINLIVEGTLKAPVDTKNFKADAGWVAFQNIDHFTLSGKGVFDGQGPAVWGKKCARSSYCGALPINLKFNFLTNSMVRDVTTKDSKQFHVNVLGCKNLSFYHFTVSAPEESLNTDGIHIGRSSGINITNTNIKTGDDCISIGDGSEQITIDQVTCGPGHGISVGSLGKYANEAPVVGIKVTGSTLTNTQNGIRVKTWPASPAGIASNMHFEDIIMNNVGNPILIDQEYCPYSQCKQQIPSRVKISDVTFKNIRGTSSTELAVKLVCSSGVPCQNVQLTDINLKFNGGAPTSICKNVKPILGGVQQPRSCSA
ncbi:hypothetical protein VitviT2T_018075 [Vitis vinifera]|uniref:Polygalacturonase n=3 Tax=Vitis vinifera TaxID=29760 RepID=D7TD16_VITVI|eukprot:XP_002274096.1 PREDICTED: exopolygalacturonase [Vitis vinifera]